MKIHKVSNQELIEKVFSVYFKKCFNCGCDNEEVYYLYTNAEEMDEETRKACLGKTEHVCNTVPLCRECALVFTTLPFLKVRIGRRYVRYMSSKQRFYNTECNCVL
jgi:hypothetical protein